MAYINCSLVSCQNGGECLMIDTQAICDCIPCFTGPRCEQNVTTFVPLYAVWWYNLPRHVNSFFILLQCFVIIIMIDSLLCIQTILPGRRILITNLGVYLTASNIARVIVGILGQIIILRSLNPLAHTKNYVLLSLVFSFIYVSTWSSSCVSIERMLIQIRHFDTLLYESRRRSIIIMVLLIVFVLLTQFFIPLGIYLQQEEKFNDSLEILIRAVTLIHNILPFMLHFCASLIVLSALVRRQRELGVPHRCGYVVWQQLQKHRDFFLQPVMYICFTLPFLVIFLLGIYIDDDCTKVDRVYSRKQILVFIEGLAIIPMVFVFPVLILPNKIYMAEFQRSSILGQCYRKLKSRYHTCCSRTSEVRNTDVYTIQGCQIETLEIRSLN